jgi:hypothetical protein
MGEKEEDKRDALHEKAYGHDALATEPVGGNGNTEPGKGAEHGHDHEDTGRRSFGQSPLLCYRDEEQHQDGMAGASPKMNPNQVPERAGLPGLSQKYSGPNLSGFSMLHPPDRLVPASAIGPQADLSRLVMEKPD